MKKIFMFLGLTMLCFTGFITSVKASTTTKIYTRHENRYTNITETYGDFTIRDYYYYETEEWVVDGTFRIFEGSCPDGWAFVPDPGGGVTPSSIEEANGNGNSSISIDLEYLLLSYIQCEKIGSGYFISQSSENWEEVETGTKYWTDIPTSEKISFDYNSMGNGPNVDMILIEGELLLIFLNNTYEFGIDRYTHYERNQYNDIFPVLETNFLTNYYALNDCSEADNSYFHQLASYNGDTTNENNQKYVCQVPNLDESYEVVYSGLGFLEVDPLNYGTYNFADGGYFNAGIDAHYIQDVYPYLIWGNTFLDDSLVKERFIWDYDSGMGWLGIDLHNERGSVLYDHPLYLALLYTNISQFEIGDIQFLITNMYYIN